MSVTTRSSVATLFKNLLEHPEQFRKLRDHPELLNSAIDENLRYSPPVQLIPRQTNQDFNLSGTKIPRGSLVFCLIGAANRDRNIFEDADNFDITRSVNSSGLTKKLDHLSFGYGLHRCIGAMLSQAEMGIVVKYILEKTRKIRFSEGFIYEEVGTYTRGPKAMRIRFETI